MRPEQKLSEKIRKRIEEHSLERAARSLGLSRLSTVKLAAGLDVTWGVIAAATLALEKEEVES